MKIVGTGLTGMIGRRLVQVLKKDHEVVCLRRKISSPSSADLKEIVWDPGKGDPSDSAPVLEGADAVINLSGENIAGKRWTSSQKEVLRSSRLVTTRALVDGMRACASKPKVFLSASAIGFYGPRDSKAVDETAAAGRDFLSGLCQEWETAAGEAEALGVRTVFLRTGIVLAKEGGALAKMTPPFRCFLGGPLGSGEQMMSWVHIEDEVNAIAHCLRTAQISGPVNLTAPHPVSMREFASRLGSVLRRPSLLPVPGFALKLLLGEMSQMLLTGQNCSPAKLVRSGFIFKHPRLEPALKDILL